MDLGQFGMGNVSGMALQGHFEGLEAPEVVFWPNFKSYKGWEKIFQMLLSLGLSGSSFRTLSIGIKIKFYICANLGHQ